MGASSLLACLAVLFALSFGYVTSKHILDAWQRNEVSASMLASSRREQFQIKLQNAAKPFMPVAKRALRLKYVDQTAREAYLMLQSRNISINEELIVALSVEAAMIVGVLLSFLTLSPTFGIASACIVLIAGAGLVHNWSEKSNTQMREEVPEAFRSLITCFRAGQSLPQALDTTSNEIKGSLGRLFKVAASRLEMGDTTKDALSILKGHRSIPELSFVAVALDVQHKSGGSIAPVLESAQESVEGELALQRSLRVQTAQAKLSATIVTIMPFVLVAFFSAMSPDFLKPFFSSIFGIILLSVALAMQVIGVLIVRHMLHIDTE